MEAERQDFFRTLLQERLNALVQNAGDNIDKLTHEREATGDAMDIATMESNRDFTLRLADRERRLVKKIREAIGRIDEGDYGVCVACGDDIAERRLMARPMATHCIDCKTEAEQLERRRRIW